MFPLVEHLPADSNSLFFKSVSVCEANVRVKNRLGLHLRAASALAESLKLFSSKATLSDGREEVNARSVMKLMMLGAAQGTQLKAKTEGEDASQAMAAIVALFESGFGED